MDITTFCVLLLLATTSFASQKSSSSQCKPKNCPKGPEITCPFWLSHQPNDGDDEQQGLLCGPPDFQIACNSDGFPVLANQHDYIIRDFFPDNYSIVLSFASSSMSSCSTPLRSLTLDPPFILASNVRTLYFFYNCSRVPPEGSKVYPLIDNCSTDDSNRYSFVVSGNGLSLPEEVASCKRVVESPVSDYDYGGDGFDFVKILKTGFVLNWTAPNCSDCSASGGCCAFENRRSLSFSPQSSQPTSSPQGQKTNLGLKIGIGVGASVGSVLLMLILFVIYLRCKRKPYDHPPSSSLLSTSRLLSDLSSKVQVFSYAELEEATNNFGSDNELADGGFGTVYYGKLKDGREVAVKRLYETNYKRVEQFMNEIDIPTRLRHRNLVTLYGCTSHRSRELLLVYEYIPNGTVADHLHGERTKKPGSLPWSVRMNIAVETASALSYLHASEIIHRDVKTTNILLDENFVVKVADFGLSRLFPNDVSHVSTAPQGTPGYVDPEYHQCYQLTSRSDVFSFGVVLVELISSMPAVDITRHRHEINLSNMAINKIQGDALHELVDHSLGFDSDESIGKMMTAVAELAFQCLQSDKDLRPSMEQVLQNLQDIQRLGGNNDPKEKGIKMMQDVRSDDAVLLTSVDQRPISPDSVTLKWQSITSTPNTSS